MGQHMFAKCVQGMLATKTRIVGEPNLRSFTLASTPPFPRVFAAAACAVLSSHLHFLPHFDEIVVVEQKDSTG